MNNNENLSVTETQKQRLMEFFKTGKKITSLEALSQLGIYRLSARMSELENVGVTISRERITITNRYGQEVRVMRYWIETFRKAVELKSIANKQPRLRIFNPKAYDEAEAAKKELDDLIKNNAFLFDKYK